MCYQTARRQFHEDSNLAARVLSIASLSVMIDWAWNTPQYGVQLTSARCRGFSHT